MNRVKSSLNGKQMSTNHARIAAILLAGDGGPGEGGDDVVNVTTQIANNFSLLADLSGIIRFTTVAGKPASNNYAGKVAQEIDTGNLFIYDGGQWQILQGTTHVCTSGTRPSGASYTLYNGLKIFETDTKMERVYNSSLARWQWVAGSKETRQVPLPSKTGTVGAYVSFPITAGGTVVSQTNDPDSAFIIDTTVGSEGIKVRDAGIYRASIYVTSSANAADALTTIFVNGSSVFVSYRFGPSGAIQGVSVPYKANANDVFIPKVYTYSGTQSQNGWMTLEKISEV